MKSSFFASSISALLTERRFFITLEYSLSEAITAVVRLSINENSIFDSNLYSPLTHRENVIGLFVVLYSIIVYSHILLNPNSCMAKNVIFLGINILAIGTSLST